MSDTSSRPPPSKPPLVASTGGGSVLKNALKMSFGTSMSRVLGLVREQLFATLFTREITDAWTLAWKIPNLFRRLLGEGSLAVNFLPIFVHEQTQSEENARKFSSGFFTMVFLFLIVFTAAGILFSGEMVALLVEQSYQADHEKFLRTVYYAKVMFSFIFLMSIFALFMALLNAANEFFWPAIAPTFFNIAMIVSTLIPQHWLPVRGEILCWGVLVGGLMQVMVLIPPLRRRGLLPHFTLKIAWGPSRRVVLNMLPGMLGTGLMQLSSVVNGYFVSSLPEGSPSYINWADRLLELPLSLVAVSIGTALLPQLSLLISSKRNEEYQEQIISSMSVAFYLMFPCALTLYIFALPIVQTLFQYGQFTLSDALATAGVVRIYAFILISAGFTRIFVTAYYSAKITWFPAVASAGAFIAHILLAPKLMAAFGLGGLVFSTFLSGLINFTLLWRGFSRFIMPLELSRLLHKLKGMLIPGAAMLLLLVIAESFYSASMVWYLRIVYLFVFGSAAASVYLYLSYRFAVPEYGESFAKILRRLSKKTKGK